MRFTHGVVAFCKDRCKVPQRRPASRASRDEGSAHETRCACACTVIETGRHRGPSDRRWRGGRRTLLSLFRDAACPFCNFRIYELTGHHHALSSLGLNVIAVFQSSPAAVRRFVARQPRPFRVVAEPLGETHDLYGLEYSLWRKLKAIVNRVCPRCSAACPFEGIELFLARGLIACASAASAHRRESPIAM